MSSAAPTSRPDYYSACYRQWHDDSDGHFEAMADYFAYKLRRLLPEDRKARILEIGCGMGFAIGGLQKLGYVNVEGMDADAGQIELARRRQLPVQQVTIGDYGAFMAARENTCDAIVAIDVLEHLPVADHLEFLEAVRRALRPAGRFVCQVPNGNSTISGRYRYIDWTHRTSFTEHSLEMVLRLAGFTAVEIREADPNRFPFRRPMRLPKWALLAVVRAFRRIVLVAECEGRAGWNAPLTPNIIGVARK